MEFEVGDRVRFRDGRYADQIIHVAEVYGPGGWRDLVRIKGGQGRWGNVRKVLLEKVRSRLQRPQQTDDPHAGMLYCEYSDRWIWL